LDKRRYVEIISTHQENKSHTTLEVGFSGAVRPGQFFMITDYENGEKPFSVSRITSDTIMFTIKNTGEFSSKLCGMKEGEKISLRGPYGNGFNTALLKGKKLLFVGGGCGTAPLRSLLEEVESSSRVTFVNGARDSDELLFGGVLKSVLAQADVTDDGSNGRKGSTLDYVKSEINIDDYDAVVLSGPEGMLKAFVNYLSDFKVKAFFLIERYMKCAIGICGQCCVDPEGVRVCIEGPVFTKEKLAGLTEFGLYKRDAAGIKHYS
jgi:dihydroorotate dehydrogenase electron transfer subunit